MKFRKISVRHLTSLPFISKQYIWKFENWREGEREVEGGAAGGVDRQKAALKLLNTPCIANNCVPQYFYPRCATIVLHTMRSTDEL